MLSRTTVFVGSAIACIAFGLWAWVDVSFPGEKSARASVGSADAESEDVQNDLSRLRTEVARLSNQVRDRGDRSDRGADGPDPDEVEDASGHVETYEGEAPPTREEHEAEIEAEVARRTFVLDSALKEEEEDYGWSRQMDDEVEAMLASNMMQNSELVEMECGSTFCKMRMQHGSLEEFESVPDAMNDLDHQFAYIRGEQHEPGEDMFTTVFFSRTGHKLPR